MSHKTSFPPSQHPSVGIYGGSFNPIHTGHIGLGEWLCQKGFVDELWFLVSPLNPLKRQVQDSLLTDEERLDLAQRAVSDHSCLKASAFELSLPRPSYMVHTLAALRAAYPNKNFTLVIGADNWHCFDQWKDHEEILRHHRVIIYPRTGYAINPSDLPPQVLYADKAPLYDISSTEIRQQIAHNPHYKGEWLHPEVWKEIQQRGLYR